MHATSFFLLINRHFVPLALFYETKERKKIEENIWSYILFTYVRSFVNKIQLFAMFVFESEYSFETCIYSVQSQNHRNAIAIRRIIARIFWHEKNCNTPLCNSDKTDIFSFSCIRLYLFSGWIEEDSYSHMTLPFAMKKNGTFSWVGIFFSHSKMYVLSFRCVQHWL